VTACARQALTPLAGTVLKQVMLVPATQDEYIPGGELPENFLINFLCEKMNNLFLRVFYLCLLEINIPALLALNIVNRS